MKKSNISVDDEANIFAMAAASFLQVGQGIIVPLNGKKYIVGKPDADNVEIYDGEKEHREDGLIIDL